jgi:hypothetical protein
MEKAMHKTLFAFIAACVAFVGIYLDKTIIADSQVRYLLLLGLTQVEFFAWLFVISLMNNQSAHAGYIRALEHRINDIVGHPVSFWESEIARRFIASRRGTFFWSTTLLVVLSFLVFGLCTILILEHFRSVWLGIALLFEVALTFVLLVAGTRETDRVYAYAKTLFQKSR